MANEKNIYLETLKAAFQEYDTSFEKVAFTGEYNDLKNKPIIPTTVAELTDASDYATTTVTDALDDRIDAIVAEGGEPNTIETVKVNGTALTPDANKVVDVTVPTTVASLTDASNYATTEYVDQNGGKIDKIKVNGTEQTISTTDKSVDLTVPVVTIDSEGRRAVYLSPDGSTQGDHIALFNDVSAVEQALAEVAESIPTVPTAVSAFTNDSGYQTASEVNSAIGTALASVYKYKGSVADQAALPTVDNVTGDVYDVQDTGMNYAWNGTAWDALGAVFNINYATNAEAIAIVDEVIASRS